MRKKYTKWLRVDDVDAVTLIDDAHGSVDMSTEVCYFMTREGVEYHIPMGRIACVKIYDKCDIIQTPGSRGRSDSAKDTAKGIPTKARAESWD